MINIRRQPGDILLELGGGDRPVVHPRVMGGRDINIDVRTCYTPDGKQTTDFEANLNEPLPIQSSEFDGVVSVWAFEHVSWRKLPDLIAETYRVTKPGGSLSLVLPNTEAQIRYILSGKAAQHKDGAFVESSRILFGDANYSSNFHSSYLSPSIISELLNNVGYADVKITAYGELATDMVVEASKPLITKVLGAAYDLPKAKTIDEEIRQSQKARLIGTNKPDFKTEEELKEAVAGDDGFGGISVGHGDVALGKMPPATFLKEFPSTAAAEPYDPAKTFDRQYFDGGKMGGGYQIYLDFPCHDITAKHILVRKPESVLELGPGRGYVLKRIQDAGVNGTGLDVSKHSYLTRVADGVLNWDINKIEWPMPANTEVDLCYSIAVLEHIPEDKLPAVIKEMQRTCKRGLHGVFFCPSGQDGDKTKLTLKPKEWWLNLFHSVAPHWPCEIVDKNELENGEFPAEVRKGDGKVKLNLGCAQTQFHYGWINVDCLDLMQWSQSQGYNYVKADISKGLPFKTDESSLIYSAHCLEHFTYKDGLNLLKECRRCIKADGAMRIIVPNARLLSEMYSGPGLREQGRLNDFDQLNSGCAECPTAVGKMWSLLGVGHQSAYDGQTLIKMLEETGWVPSIAGFRQSIGNMSTESYSVNDGMRYHLKQILRETLDVLPSLSLYVEAVPRIES